MKFRIFVKYTSANCAGVLALENTEVVNFVAVIKVFFLLNLLSVLLFASVSSKSWSLDVHFHCLHFTNHWLQFAINYTIVVYFDCVENSPGTTLDFADWVYAHFACSL